MRRRNVLPYVLLLVLTLLAVGAAALAVTQGPATVGPAAVKGYVAVHCSEHGSCAVFVASPIPKGDRACVAVELHQLIRTTHDASALADGVEAILAKCEG